GAVLGRVDRAAHPQGMLRFGPALIPRIEREQSVALKALYEVDISRDVLLRETDLDVSGAGTSMPAGFEGARAEEIPASPLRRRSQGGGGAVQRIGGDLHVGPREAAGVARGLQRMGVTIRRSLTRS